MAAVVVGSAGEEVVPGPSPHAGRTQRIAAAALSFQGGVHILLPERRRRRLKAFDRGGPRKGRLLQVGLPEFVMLLC